MTNADKYLKDGVDVNQLCEILSDYIVVSITGENQKLTIYTVLKQFFKAEAKPTLTEDEKVILRNIKGFELIYRNTSGTLHFVTRRNIEINHYCESGFYRDAEIEDGECVSCINHLFQFIQPRRRI